MLYSPITNPKLNNIDLVTPNTLLEAFQNYQELLTTLYIATNQPKQFSSLNTIGPYYYFNPMQFSSPNILEDVVLFLFM
jgi:hypothetical protein